jgi:hypothetical protein
VIIQNLGGPPMEKNHLVYNSNHEVMKTNKDLAPEQRLDMKPCSGAVYEMSFLMELLKEII